MSVKLQQSNNRKRSKSNVTPNGHREDIQPTGCHRSEDTSCDMKNTGITFLLKVSVFGALLYAHIQ